MRGWKNLLDLSSDAWYGIGDTSTDVSDLVNVYCMLPAFFIDVD
jgi:hypothetical protein